MRKFFLLVPGSRYLLDILSTQTFKSSSITFVGTAINAALGAVFYIVAARTLGPAMFGLFSVSILVLTLVADIGDLGTDNGLVNFVSRYISTDKIKAYRFLKLGLKIKVILGVTILVAGLFLAKPIALHLFNKAELVVPLKIAFVGVSGLLLFSFLTHVLQALQKFWAWSGVQIGTNALRLVIILTLFAFGNLGLNNTMWAYIIIPFLGFFVGFSLMPKGFLKVKNESKVSREFFKYNKWVAAFVFLAAISGRLDTFITARLLTSTELGYYSVANQLVKIVPQIIIALGTVFAPKMASLPDLAALKIYLKKTQIMVVGLAVLGLISVPFVIYLIPIIFGSQYLQATPIFIVLLLAMLVFLISIPIHTSVFYYFSYPKLFFYVSVGHLLIIGVLGWYLVGAYGAIGAAYSVLLGTIFNFLIPLGWVMRRLRKGGGG